MIEEGNVEWNPTEIPCVLIRDLLYVYSEGACSLETEQFVEDHLFHCADCTQRLMEIEEESAEYELAEFTPLMDLISSFLQNHGKNLLKWLALMLILYLLTLGTMAAEECLTEYDCIPVTDSDYRIEEVVQFRDGEIACRYFVRYESTFRRNYIITEDNDLFFPAMRPVLDQTYHDMERSGGWILDPNKVWDHEQDAYTAVRAVYMGNPGSATLIWEEGISLTPVSEAQQADFDTFKQGRKGEVSQ